MLLQWRNQLGWGQISITTLEKSSQPGDHEHLGKMAVDCGIDVPVIGKHQMSCGGKWMLEQVGQIDASRNEVVRGN